MCLHLDDFIVTAIGSIDRLIDFISESRLFTPHIIHKYKYIVGSTLTHGLPTKVRPLISSGVHILMTFNKIFTTKQHVMAILLPPRLKQISQCVYRCVVGNADMTRAPSAYFVRMAYMASVGLQI